VILEIPKDWAGLWDSIRFQIRPKQRLDNGSGMKRGAGIHHTLNMMRMAPKRYCYEDKKKFCCFTLEEVRKSNDKTLDS
jgi:hypothetical protein